MPALIISAIFLTVTSSHRNLRISCLCFPPRSCAIFPHFLYPSDICAEAFISVLSLSIRLSSLKDPGKLHRGFTEM